MVFHVYCSPIDAVVGLFCCLFLKLNVFSCLLVGLFVLLPRSCSFARSSLCWFDETESGLLR